MFLHLPFAFWLSLVLVGPAVSGWCLSLLCACKPVSAPLSDQLSSHIVLWCCPLLGAGGAWMDPVPDALPLLCSLCPGCTCLRSYRIEDGGVISKAGSQITPCRSVLPWQDQYTDDCGAAQLLDASGVRMDTVLAALPLLCSLHSWLYSQAKLNTVNEVCMNKETIWKRVGEYEQI